MIQLIRTGTKAIAALQLFLVSADGQESRRLIEITPSIAVADQILTAEIKDSLNNSAGGAWTPSPEDVLSAFAELASERGQRDIAAKALGGSDMALPLKRLKTSRYQVFGLLIGKHKYLLFDATPLQSDVPELWLKDCISNYVYDGGAAYWWVMIDHASMRVTTSGRRP
jgi:hypothetical protein